MTDRLRVDLGDRGYDIVIAERLLTDAGRIMVPLLTGKNVIIISDETVARLYLHRLSNALEEAHIRARTIIVKPGEATKSLSAFCELIEQIIEQKPDRHTTLIALGGGVIGDITGFAASVLLRGVRFIQIPTTLLAQVDSSVGGKTGINSAFGKNLIGSFHQPSLVLSDISTLASLPRRELMAGYAEMLKYALINDGPFFNWLEQNATAMLAGDTALLTYGIMHSCQAKAAIVVADEKENGLRALLNFGHTFGHALEAETGFSDVLLHGEAVAIGMVLAFQTSVKMALCKASELERVLAHYQAVGLPSSPHYIPRKWSIDALISHFNHDKKSKNGKPTFILTQGIGQAMVCDAVELSDIRAALVEAGIAM